MGSWGRRGSLFFFFFFCFFLNSEFLVLWFYVSKRYILEILYSTLHNGLKENRSKDIDQFFQISILSSSLILRMLIRFRATRLSVHDGNSSHPYLA
jgi:hypothetical protein